jgi:hypothetical protein
VAKPAPWGVACDGNCWSYDAARPSKNRTSVWGAKGDGENADINHRLDVLQNPAMYASLKDDERLRCHDIMQQDYDVYDSDSIWWRPSVS